MSVSDLVDGVMLFTIPPSLSTKCPIPFLMVSRTVSLCNDPDPLVTGTPCDFDGHYQSR